MCACSVMSNSLQPHGLQPTRLLCPWNSPCKKTGVDSLALLQRIFPIQGLNLGLLPCRQVLYCLRAREAYTLELLKMSSHKYIELLSYNLSLKTIGLAFLDDSCRKLVKILKNISCFMLSLKRKMHS